MSDDNARTTAVEQLELLGLSAYAARTFVALVGLEPATAKAVSEHADVPRTRVYDAADELTEWGLVEIKSSNPKTFTAVPVDTATRRVSEEFERRIEELHGALETIDMGD